MKYALLIYQDDAFEKQWANASDDEKAEVYDEYSKFDQLLRDRGALIEGNELALSVTAATVHKNGQDAVITDGPFAETTEHLGGYFVVNARDLDEALELARALPSEVVEVRAIVEPEAAS